MLELKVLVRELGAIDGLATRTIPLGEVATLPTKKHIIKASNVQKHIVALGQRALWSNMQMQPAKPTLMAWQFAVQVQLVRLTCLCS